MSSTFGAMLLAVMVAAAGLASSPPLLARASSDLIVPTTFSTIQAAVDAASPGATVRVLNGTYAEQVTISKSLTLRGEEDTVVKPPSGPLAVGILGDPRPKLITISGGATVKISHLSVMGAPHAGCLGAGVDVAGRATLTLTEVEVANVQNTAFCHGNGIKVGRKFSQLTGPDAVGHLTVSHSRIHDFENDGVSIFGTGTTAKLSHNQIRHGAQGVTMLDGASADIDHNSFADLRCTGDIGCGPDPLNDIQGYGIGVFNVTADTAVSHNDISGSDIGIYLAEDTNCCTLTHNEVIDSTFIGYVLQDGTYSIDHNSVSGGPVGVGIAAGAVDTLATLSHMEIDDPSLAAVKTYACCGFVSSFALQNPGSEDHGR